jgi:hypothetical protein
VQFESQHLKDVKATWTGDGVKSENPLPEFEPQISSPQPIFYSLQSAFQVMKAMNSEAKNAGSL